MEFNLSSFPSEARSAGGARREKPFPSGKVSSGREKRQPEMISHSAGAKGPGPDRLGFRPFRPGLGGTGVVGGGRYIVHFHKVSFFNSF